MLRKWISLLMAVALLWCAGALADETQELCALYDGDTLVGTGVVMGNDACVLTSGSVLRSGAPLTVRVAGQVREVVDAAGESLDGPVLLTLDGPTGLDVWHIAPQLEPGAIGYLGLLADGAVATGACSRVSPVFAQGHAAMTLTAQEGLLPGTLILDKYGSVAGLITATYGEGQGRYLAYTNESLYFMLTTLAESTPDRGGAPLQAQGYTPVMGAILSQQRGVLGVSWQHLRMDPAKGEIITVVMQDLDNPYAIMGQRTLEDGSCEMAAAPGRTYMAWVMQTSEPVDMTQVRFGDEYLSLTTNEAVPFTDYAFQDTQAYLTALPAGAEVGDTEVIPPVDALTAEQLTTWDVYMQVTSTYAVTEQHEAVLGAVLETPQGWALTAEMGYLFDPSVMTEDNWHMPVGALFQSAASACEDGQLAPGAYTLTYYLDGMSASQVTILVE